MHDLMAFLSEHCNRSIHKFEKSNIVICPIGPWGYPSFLYIGDFNSEETESLDILSKKIQCDVDWKNIVIQM